jgi:predicted nucleotidyltransferase component of viral defense system
MNADFKTFLAATAEDRRDAFLGAGRRLGTPEQNIEKDFWVSWTLDALFNGAEAGGPRLLFKGGTSLSKAFGLISRFSEDIDITIFRDDLGEAADVADLAALGGKQRRKRLDAIKAAAQTHVNGAMRAQMAARLTEALETAGSVPSGTRR